MSNNIKKEVQAKWGTDGNMAVIYKVEDLLLWYITDQDPFFISGQKVSVEEVNANKPYKFSKYSIDKIPNDAYISVSFTWG